MRYAILPPVSTQFYNFGNNETQITNSDVPMAMNHNVNLQGSSVIWDSCDWNQQRSDSFAIPCQPIVKFQPCSVNLRGYQSTSSDMKSISYQAMLSKKISVPDVEMDSGTIKLRKRAYEVGSLMPQTGINDVLEHEKARFSREEGNYMEVMLQVPVRSQKVSDKITALQKLVSPYGKTDTASVLQEASLYIKSMNRFSKTRLQCGVGRLEEERTLLGSYIISAKFDTGRPSSSS